MVTDARGTSVAVIGGGVGGLSVACYLADAGADVTVIEKNETLGGRASVLERDGFRFDMGPSWYLMPDVFERFFDDFDRRPDDYYDLQRLDPHYRVFFKELANHLPVGAPKPAVEADVVDVTGDPVEMARVFESYEDGAGDALKEYLDTAAHTYEVGMEHFVYTDRGRFRDYVDWDVIKNARGLGLMGSMQDHVSDYFEHPKLQQLVQYSLVFLGGSPHNTPALYNLMSHVDFGLGVYYPEGGMYSVVDALVTLAGELGVTYETGAPIRAIDGRRGNMTVQSTSRDWNVDVVVSDADYAYTEQELLTPEHRQYDEDYWEDRVYAPSAYLCYLGVEGELPELAHHSLVLPEDWDQHFASIFDDPAWPEDPAYYVCHPSATDDTVAPEGHSNLFLLVPIAPGMDDGRTARTEMRDRLLADLARHTGTDVRDRIVVEEDFCVSDFGRRYNAREGSALGLAHTLRQTGPLRPDHRSSAMDGLYFTGGFTRPGIGVPMCLISGEHAADAVLEDLAKTPLA